MYNVRFLANKRPAYGREKTTNLYVRRIFRFPSFFFWKSHGISGHVAILHTKLEHAARKFQRVVTVCYSTDGVDTGSGRAESNFAL